jgi:hypothetical protein
VGVGDWLVELQDATANVERYYNPAVDSSAKFDIIRKLAKLADLIKSSYKTKGELTISNSG